MNTYWNIWNGTSVITERNVNRLVVYKSNKLIDVKDSTEFNQIRSGRRAMRAAKHLQSINDEECVRRRHREAEPDKVQRRVAEEEYMSWKRYGRSSRSSSSREWEDMR